MCDFFLVNHRKPITVLQKTICAVCEQPVAYLEKRHVGCEIFAIGTREQILMLDVQLAIFGLANFKFYHSHNICALLVHKHGIARVYNPRFLTSYLGYCVAKPAHMIKPYICDDTEFIIATANICCIMQPPHARFKHRVLDAFFCECPQCKSHHKLKP